MLFNLKFYVEAPWKLVSHTYVIYFLAPLEFLLDNDLMKDVESILSCLYWKVQSFGLFKIFVHLFSGLCKKC